VKYVADSSLNATPMKINIFFSFDAAHYTIHLGHREYNLGDVMILVLLGFTDVSEEYIVSFFTVEE
jgi:hypothetical protein